MAEIVLDDDEVMDSSAMAEAMGFSGFGMQRPPSKKRKFNPHADAAVSAPVANGKTAPSSTGANSAPLGQRKPLRLPSPSSDLPTRTLPTSGANDGKVDTNEIDLDDEGDENQDNRESSRYMDTSRPSRGYYPDELAEIEAQQKIDAIISSSVPGLPARPPLAADAGESLNRHGSEHGYGQQLYGHQQRNPRQGRGNGKRHHRQHSAEDSGAPWWERYYDPRVNQNPWEDLEKQMGLQPRGTWLPRNAEMAETAVLETRETHIITEEKGVGKDPMDESNTSQEVIS